jgi:radical SAM protein with 4Fe4S-binding SPASM domain
LKELWQSNRWDLFRGLGLDSLKGDCRDCDKLGSGCNGGCRAAALAYKGDLFAQDPFCWKNV